MSPEYVVVDLRRGGGSQEQLLALAAEGYELVPPDGLAIFAPAARRVRTTKRVTIDDPSKQAK